MNKTPFLVCWMCDNPQKSAMAIRSLMLLMTVGALSVDAGCPVSASTARGTLSSLDLVDLDTYVSHPPNLKAIKAVHTITMRWDRGTILHGFKDHLLGSLS